MSEPISGTAAGVAGWKIIGGLAGMGGIAAGMAAFVVMTMTTPTDRKEWRVALACTLVGSIGGGAALIKYVGVENWSHDLIGLMAQGGLMFFCGLPAWAAVRALFKFTNKRRDADLAEIVNDVKGMM